MFGFVGGNYFFLWFGGVGVYYGYVGSYCGFSFYWLYFLREWFDGN